MKAKILLYLIVVLQGCVAFRGVVGKYASKNNSNVFQLKEDSTFSYQYRAYHLFEYSSGKWTMAGKSSILLKSKIESVIVPMGVEQDGINSHGKNVITFMLAIKGGIALSNYKCSIILNDSLYRITQCDSLSSIEIPSHVNKLSLHFNREPKVPNYNYIPMPVITNDYSFQGKSNNLAVTIVFDDSLFFYRSFNNEVLKIGNNHIKIFNPHLKKWEKISRTSNTANIFSKFRGGD